MLIGIGLILILGYLAGKIFEKIQLPSLIGMLLIGVLLGPYIGNVLSSELLLVSQEIRSFALILILLRAGLGIRKEQLKQVGSIALRLSNISCLLEGFAVTSVSCLE